MVNRPTQIGLSVNYWHGGQHISIKSKWVSYTVERTNGKAVVRDNKYTLW